MISGLYTSSTAMSMYESALNATSNNLANVNTDSFKRSIVDFQDLVYTGADNQQIGFGGRAAAIETRDYRQGPLRITDSPLDLFIGGDGFFEVLLPNGQTAYTRDGSFQRDVTGRLVTDDGFVLQPEIILPADTESVTISSDGRVSVVTGSNPDTQTPVGNIPLHRFVNPTGLREIGRNLVQATGASGEVITGVPGTSVFGSLTQGALEGSNVELVDELADLITSQRAFEVNSRVLATTLEVLDSAYEIIR